MIEWPPQKHNLKPIERLTQVVQKFWPPLHIRGHCGRNTDKGCTDVSVHSGGEAHSFFLTAVNGFLQSVDHLFIGVDFIIEQHAVIRVSSVPEHKIKS